jgi:hypothetical protein
MLMVEPEDGRLFHPLPSDKVRGVFWPGSAVKFAGAEGGATRGSEGEKPWAADMRRAARRSRHVFTIFLEARVSSGDEAHLQPPEPLADGVP